MSVCLSNRVFICLYLTEYLYQPLPPPPPLSPSFRSPFGGRLVATKVPVHTQHIRLPLQLQDLSSCGGWDFWRVQQDVTDVLPVCDGKCSLLWLVVQQQSEWHLQLRKPGEEGGLSRWLLYTGGWGSNQRAYGSTGQYLVKPLPPPPSRACVTGVREGMTDSSIRTETWGTEQVSCTSGSQAVQWDTTGVWQGYGC